MNDDNKHTEFMHAALLHAAATIAAGFVQAEGYEGTAQTETAADAALDILEALDRKMQERSHARRALKNK